MLRLIIFFQFLIFSCFCHAAGMYGAYLVRLKTAAVPMAPGQRSNDVAYLKKQGQRTFARFESRIAGYLTNDKATKGPGRASSPTFKGIDKYWFINSMRMQVRSDFVDKLKNFPEVLEVVPDERIELSIDDQHDEQSASSILSELGFSKLHQQGLNGSGVRIGVLDSGLVEHSEFTDKVVAYRDFTSKPAEGKADSYGHGSHVAGLLVGGKGSGQQIGCAPGAKLVVARVLEPVARGNDQQANQKSLEAFASRILQAMQWVMDPDGNPETKDYPQIINNSWGFSKGMPLSKSFFDEALAKWKELGIIPVFAAGNTGQQGENSIYYPGTSEDVLTVGALRGEERAWFSSIGSVDVLKPDFVMPGYQLFSLKRSRSGAIEYGKMSGTSQAAPLLVGLLAIMKQIDPCLSMSAAYDLLRADVSDMGAVGWDPEYGWGQPQVSLLVETTRVRLNGLLGTGAQSTFEYYLKYARDFSQSKNSDSLAKMQSLESAYYNFLETKLNEGQIIVVKKWINRLDNYSNNFPKYFTRLKNLALGKLRYLSIDKGLTGIVDGK